MAGLKPGDRRVIDGIECVVVTGDRVPRRFWAAQRAHKDVSVEGSGSLTVVAMLNPSGSWRFRDDPPDHPFNYGEFHENHLDNFFNTENYAVFIPVEYTEAERNEFGVVSP